MRRRTNYAANYRLFDCFVGNIIATFRYYLVSILSYLDLSRLAIASHPLHKRAFLRWRFFTSR